MKAYGLGDDEDEVSGDFALGQVNTQELENQRYSDTVQQMQSLGDTVACSIPANASVQDLLCAVRNDIDGSLAFRMGDGSETATSGLRVNGRLVLADVSNVADLASSSGRIKIEPLTGYPVIRDLMVDYSKFEENRSKVNPWMKSEPRDGEYIINGTAMGIMASETANTLHSLSDVKSYYLLHSDVRHSCL